MTHLRSKPEKLPFRITNGGFEPADGYVAAQMRKRGYNIGDLVFCVVTKPRTHGLNRLVHRIGGLVAANIEAFAGLDGHAALKKIQIDGNIACDEHVIDLPGVGRCKVISPNSLSFDSLDEGQFREVARAMCRFIAGTHWHGMTPEAIEKMAESFVDE